LHFKESDNVLPLKCLLIVFIMTDVEIEILDPVHSKILKGRELLKPCLSYSDYFYRQSQYRKIRKEYKKSLIGKGGIFLTGFINRVREYCDRQNISHSVDETYADHLSPEREPHLSGKNLKEGKWAFQWDLIGAAINYQRGVIKSATASGKTIQMLGVLSCYPSARVLFLSNTHVPISQFSKEVKAHRADLPKKIHSTTIQKFYRKKPDSYIDEFDIILIDECHEGMSSLNGMYARVLTNCMAPMRLGFTATLPNSEKDRIILEGLLGPVLEEYTIQEGVEDGVLSKPEIIISKLPTNHDVKKLRTYRDVYKTGVVENKALNRKVITDAIVDIDRGKTVLILVLEIAHGENIVEMAKSIYNIDFVFVQGSTGADIRMEIKDAMEDKSIKCVVATAVFRKALNIPSLDTVINACGGKSEVMTLQAIGRGLRSTDDKSYVTIRDYFNPSHYYLISHFGHRLCLYFDEEWL